MPHRLEISKDMRLVLRYPSRAVYPGLTNLISGMLPL